MFSHIPDDLNSLKLLSCVLTLLAVVLIWPSENCSCVKAIKIQIIFGAVTKDRLHHTLSCKEICAEYFKLLILKVESSYWKCTIVCHENDLGPSLCSGLTCNQSSCCLYEMTGIRKETGVLWTSNLPFNSLMGLHLGTCLGNSHNLYKSCSLIHVSDIKCCIKARNPL